MPQTTSCFYLFITNCQPHWGIGVVTLIDLYCPDLPLGINMNPETVMAGHVIMY